MIRSPLFRNVVATLMNSTKSDLMVMSPGAAAAEELAPNVFAPPPEFAPKIVFLPPFMVMFPVARIVAPDIRVAAGVAETAVLHLEQLHLRLMR